MEQIDRPEPAFGSSTAVPSSPLPGATGEQPGWAPAAHLAHLHVPEIVASLWQRLMAAVRTPSRVFDRDGQRVVLVVGIAAVRRQSDGALHVDVWRECDGRLQWVASDPRTVVLQTMPAAWVWLDLISNAVTFELRWHLCRCGVAFDDADLRVYAHDLFAYFRRHLVRHADLRQMRRRVAAALALDPDAVRIARRIIDVAPGSGPGRLSAYNLVVRHLEACRLLERELPQAVPLYAAFVERGDFPRMAQPAQALRQFLRDQGLGRCTWRLLVKAGPRLMLPLRDFYVGDTGVAMLDYLRILQALGLRRELPSWATWAILSRVANPASRHQGHLRELHRAAALFGHALRSCIALQPAPVGEFASVLEWLASERPRLDKMQYRAGWPWLVSRTMDWMALRRKEIEAQAASWSTPFVSMPMGARELVALRTVRDLWDEARAMHHCIDDYADHCARGDALVVSVRSGSGRRSATALYKRQGQRWSLAQVRGVANRCPPREVEGAAKFLEGMLNAPCEWPPEAELEPDAGALAGVPPHWTEPRRMPPNARLAVEVAWSWGPMNSRQSRYLISGDREGRHWLLWERHFDDNYGRWERTAQVVAHAAKGGVTEAVAAARMLAACWRREIKEAKLDEFHQVLSNGVVAEEDLAQLAKHLWSSTQTRGLSQGEVEGCHRNQAPTQHD
jgi:hypothetical protein